MDLFRGCRSSQAPVDPSLMPVQFVRNAQTAHPTGDPNFEVKQCIGHSGITEAESDPFLTCDEFGPMPSRNEAYGDDSDKGFDVGWHPHCGMEILSYMIAGKGRHADSMGNRETFDSPGFQWISVGSGIEHAEGGGTPKGEIGHGFQIWLRMPIANMGDDPRYGTVTPTEIPQVTLEGGLVRVIAGPLDGLVGPAQFAVTVQMLDVELEPGAEWSYTCPDNMDNAMFYAFKGSAMLNSSSPLKAQQIARFDTSAGPRTTLLTAGSGGYRGLVFTGKMTKEKILQHGPFVCSSRAQLDGMFSKYQSGKFPPKRVPWNYRDASQRPMPDA
mmetsp:Transcript_31321/g.80513  ORF Transcript_31321/g.80513 Transcript_31321/m.80513 type:complete len:328 (+) Transcript_31321:87-1070(+)